MEVREAPKLGGGGDGDTGELADALRDFWYPAALSGEVTAAGPVVAARVLGEDLVLWRSAGGRVAAFRDLCMHRGSRLSLGWVDGEDLVCAYHGWSYGGDGACTRIPSIPRERGIPAKARAVSYRCEERYGLVFVCLGTPRLPIGDLPEYGDPACRTFFFGRHRWQTSAARMVENFIDISHFPWVHPGLLADRDQPLVDPPLNVRQGEHTLYFEARSQGRDRVTGAATTLDVVTYEVTLPFTVRSVRTTPTGERLVFHFLVAPLSDKEIDRYMLLSRNYALDEDDERFRRFSLTVAEQDRVVVESQRPEELPLDLSEELHVRGPDDTGVLYRRMLRSLIPDVR